MRPGFPWAFCLSIVALLATSSAAAAEPLAFDVLGSQYREQVRPLLEQFCLDCHSTKSQEGELDLERFAALDDVRGATKTWLKVVEMLDNGEMPPQDAEQPAVDQKKQLRAWIQDYLDAEAHASAGDPGPVVLRRLSNAQYTYTIQDLTGVDLNPLREFPADSAAGEGFTNAGSALVMSPSLLTKYFDAGKEIARHAVLLPDGFRFSRATTSRDWTDEILAQIRQAYLLHSDPDNATKVNLQGLTWETSDAGRLPVEKYFAALLAHRAEIESGSKELTDVAADKRLNAKYLAALWGMLRDKRPSQLLDIVRTDWQDAKPAAAIVGKISQWQKALTRFQSVGHMKPWMVPVSPVVSTQEFRLKIPAPAQGDRVTLYLAAGEAGDGPTNDFVVWQRPRLVAPGRPDLLLCDVRDFTREMAALRQRIFRSTARSLAAVDDASRSTERIEAAELARKHDVDLDAVSAWLEFLGVSSRETKKLDHFTTRIDQVAGHSFVKGWGTKETPQLVANSSDEHVRIPGNLKPHGVAVHPSPTLSAAVGWESPIVGDVRIEGTVLHAHPECGNGVTWSLEIRRGSVRQVLAHGTAAGNAAATIGPIEQPVIRAGDLISLVIGPRDGNHACDLTAIDLAITSAADGGRDWNLARDVAEDVQAANPHADRYGNVNVWHFYTEPVKGGDGRPVIPGGSLLARWQSESRAEARQKLAEDVEKLLQDGPPADAQHPDALLYRQLASLRGPLFSSMRSQGSRSGSPGDASSGAGEGDWGLDPRIFGRHPSGSSMDAANLCVQAPRVIAVQLPADFAVDSEFVTTAVLDQATATGGSVQPMVATVAPGSLAELRADAPVLVSDEDTRQRFEHACDDFRLWFPAALCYIRIVPVDEVVTLTLFHREDEPLCRLMLDDRERAHLDRLWEELHFVSHDALTLVDAFAQLMEYATQDSDPRLFEPYRKPIHDRAAAFRQALLAAEPRQVDALVDFASRACRRPLTPSQTAAIRQMVVDLRAQGLAHDEAFRFSLARIFVSPEFLYRLEKAPPGSAAGPVSDWELANRLSYFLWSSVGDARLSDAAAAGRLNDPEVLAAEARRMLGDPRVRRLATEFACQWLHIYDFDAHDEKSERHFPTFSSLRGDMYEEAIRFFTDLFQRDASILEIFAADHTFLNEALARHYGISDITGPEWRRVDGLKTHGRGGILGLSATLAKQSGASRTSPILRGNWVSEVLLGEKLPRPPKDVPRLPEDETATEGLTVRQLVEKHSSDARCAKCHARMDPLGYALEGFDAIGRRRQRDLAERPIDTRARLQDGTEFVDLEGLRDYLVTKRRDAILRQFNRKLLGYALGRSVQLSDEPLLDEMAKQSEKNGFRISAAVETIVRSRQFREIRGKDSPLADAR